MVTVRRVLPTFLSHLSATAWAAPMPMVCTSGAISTERLNRSRLWFSRYCAGALWWAAWLGRGCVFIRLEAMGLAVAVPRLEPRSSASWHWRSPRWSAGPSQWLGCVSPRWQVFQVALAP